jgi:ribosomal protein S18 acetylase RimI-like enzyme
LTDILVIIDSFAGSKWLLYPAMKHILDNPIYNALNTGSKHLSCGTETAKYFIPEVAPFAGLKENTAAYFEELREISPSDASFILFTPVHLEIPEVWKINGQMDLLQLVYEQEVHPAGTDQELVSLGQEHVSQMLALTALTKPGPFFSRTIEFGNYKGIFQGGELIAMAGQRFQPLPYVEISAVCTHPDHLRKRHASLLLLAQIRLIQAVGHIPFLHVRADNESAIRAYERIGFTIRREMFVYAIGSESKIV